jgi:hypothetical protein
MKQQQLPLHYHHTEQSSRLRDVRYKRVPDIRLDQCYFLGFRISVENNYHYHDAIILADDYEAFLEGVGEEMNDIQDTQSISSHRDIALVFVRSLAMDNSNRHRNFGYERYLPHIQKILAKRDDEQFSVFGWIDEDVRLMPIKTSDALSALRIARSKSFLQMQKRFVPLEICQAHPVRLEFEGRFIVAARQIRLLLETQPGNNAYRQ